MTDAGPGGAGAGATDDPPPPPPAAQPASPPEGTVSLPEPGLAGPVAPAAVTVPQSRLVQPGPGPLGADQQGYEQLGAGQPYDGQSWYGQPDYGTLSAGAPPAGYAVAARSRPVGFGTVVRSLWFIAGIAALAVIVAPLITYPVAYTAAVATETETLQHDLQERVESGGALSFDDQEKLQTQLSDAGVPSGLIDRIHGFDDSLELTINMSPEDLTPDVCSSIAQNILTVAVQRGFRVSGVHITDPDGYKPLCQTSSVTPVADDD